MPEPDGMTPEDAMRKMAEVTSHTHGLRTRTEGLTLVIWGICLAASYFAIAVPFLAGRGERGFRPQNGTFNFTNGTFPPPQHGPPPTEFFLGSVFAPLVWSAVAIVVTIAVWRSASLSFRTGITTPRLAGVLVLWLLLFAAAHVVLEIIEPGPRSWHIAAWGIVFALFAFLDPLKFTKRSRVAVATVAGVVLLVAAYAYLADLGFRDTSFVGGVGLGLPMLAAGLLLMLRG